MIFEPLETCFRRLEAALDAAGGDRVEVSAADLERILNQVDVKQATPLENGFVVIDEIRAERMVKAAMALLPFDDGEHVYDFGFTIQATDATIEALKASDSPFAGYVISCICPDPAMAQKHYDDWAKISLQRTIGG